jgi:general secretion pathway protein B
MSFILEALAKSEQARKQSHAVPGFSLMPAPEAPAGGRRLVPYLVFGAVLANGALVFAWSGPNRLPVVADSGKVIVSRAPDTDSAAPREKPRIAEPAVTVPVPEQPVQKEKAVAKPVTVPSVAPPAAPLAVSGPAPSGTEFPVLTVAGFIKDESAAGMVIVNDRLVHEGDEISPGLRLEKILPDGLVFDFKGRRFKR